MKREDKRFIESVLKQSMYGLADQFLQDLENEPNENSPRKPTLKEAYAQIDEEVPKIIKKLSEQGIKTLKDIEENPATVTELVNKVEIRMEDNAQKLSKKRSKKTKK